MPCELLTKREVVSITPQCAVAYGAWGKGVDNKEQERRFPEEVKTSLDFIPNTGITVRHQPEYPMEFIPNRKRVGEEMTKVVVSVIEDAKRAVSWTGGDRLYLASSAPPDERGDWGFDVARRTGFEEVRLSYFACNGASAAVNDILQRKTDFGEGRVMVAAVDALGYLANPKDLICSTIFGNGTGAIAFRPKDIDLFYGVTHIIPDEFGVIRTPRGLYGLPPMEDRQDLPPWYKLGKGAKEVVAADRNGVYQLLPQLPEDQNFLQMHGPRTAMHFARIVPPVIAEVVCSFNEQFPGRERILVAAHQPSLGVLTIVENQTNRVLEKKGLPPVEIPWVLNEAEMGNASSPIPLVALARLAMSGKVRAGMEFVLSGYGVGSSVTGIALRINDP